MLSDRSNTGIQPNYTLSSAIIPVLVIFLIIISSSFILWLLLNYKLAYAVPISASVRLNSHSHSVVDTNLHIYSKTKSVTTSSVFEKAVHNTVGFKDKDIAFIKPSFTAAAYHHSFYVFYTLYKNTPARKNVTTDLTFLTSKVITETTDSSPFAFAMSYLSKNIKSIIPKSKIDMLTDADIDA
jgi:hypothetical protein